MRLGRFSAALAASLVVKGAPAPQRGTAFAGLGSDDEWFAPTPGQCLLSGVLTGAGIGLVVGALRRSDVWAPVELPARRPEPGVPPVTAARTGVGLALPVRLPEP